MTSFDTMLEALCEVAECVTGSSLASIVLWDPETRGVCHSASTGLPVPFGCATSWEEQRDIAWTQGFRTSWSTPIVSPEGATLGAFTIHCTEERTITPQDVLIADKVTRLARILVERKCADNLLKKSEAVFAEAQRRSEIEIMKVASVVKHSPDLIGFSDLENEVAYINPAGRRMLGIDLEADVTRYVMSDLRPPDEHRRFVEEIFPLLHRDGIWEGERNLRHTKTGAAIPVHQTTFFIREQGTNRRIGVAAICRDITERRRIDAVLQTSLAEKEALLKEVHHRVKNNLQLISSLLSLQAVQVADPASALLFAESRNRVRSIALVHENLYRTGDLAQVAMAAHIRTLCGYLANAFGLHDRYIALTAAGDDMELDLDRAISVGLIINELVANAVKYAFPDGRAGHVRVDLRLLDREHCGLSVEDDGVGLPTGLEEVKSESLGLGIVSDLVHQLHGDMNVARGSGTRFSIEFGLHGQARVKT
jgi:PAS domain S-box-containing protein